MFRRVEVSFKTAREDQERFVKFMVDHTVKFARDGACVILSLHYAPMFTDFIFRLFFLQRMGWLLRGHCDYICPPPSHPH